MKHIIEIPEGYEFSHTAHPILSNEGGALTLILKKKQQKTFDWYVDEYLRSDDCTTNDMICNWIPLDLITRLKDNLKQNKLQFVPWEVKIGLLKFICNDKRIAMSNLPFDFYGFDYLKKMCPNGFVESIIK